MIYFTETAPGVSFCFQFAEFILKKNIIQRESIFFRCVHRNREPVYSMFDFFHKFFLNLHPPISKGG